MMTQGARLSISILCSMLLLLLVMGVISAKTTANTIVDNSDPSCDDTLGAPYCNIQAAIDAAPNGATIQIGSSGVTQTHITNLAIVSKTLTLTSPGRVLVYPADTQTHTLRIENAAVHIENMGLRSATGVRAVAITGSSVALYACDISNNAQGGGHISASSVVTAEQCTLQFNQTTGNGAGWLVEDARLTLRSSTFANNAAANGGAIYADDGSDLQLDASSFTSNSASGDGGALYVGDTGGFFSYDQLSFSENHADRHGGAVYIARRVEFTNSNFSGNQADEDGGAIYAPEGYLGLQATVLAQNAAGQRGGAIFSAAVYGIMLSTLSENSASGDGGALYGSDLGLIEDGNWLDNTSDANCGAASVSNSTRVERSYFANNLARENGGALCNRGEATIRNSTFGNNQAVGSFGAQGIGGAILNDGTLDVTASTVVDNRARSGGGVANTGRLEIVGTILARNSADTFNGINCLNSGTMTSFGYNMYQGSALNGCSSVWTSDDVQVADPALEVEATAADNGGHTDTYALFFSSQAVNRVPQGTEGCETNATDQRGYLRIDPSSTTDGCDIGAYEYRSYTLPTAVKLQDRAVGDEGSFGRIFLLAFPLLFMTYRSVRYAK